VRYFYDTEFIEDGKTIDLISIGVVAEDGREYYAVSNEYDADNASLWVKENVLSQLPSRLEFERKNRVLIADEIGQFVIEDSRDEVQLWADYCAYDHVALCQLYGTMMDLPPNIPMFTNDFQQLWGMHGSPQLPQSSGSSHHALDDARHLFKCWNFLRDRFVTDGFSR